MSVADPDLTAQRLRESGLTMIEVLVTFVILAVGVLGVVSLLATSKTSEFESVQRARAVTLADSMLEKIRANPASLDIYASDPNNPVLTPVVGAYGATVPSPDCRTAFCAPDDLAAFDLWLWKQELLGAPVTAMMSGSVTPTAGLAQVNGCISFAPFPGDQNTGVLRVIVQWEGLQETTDGVTAAPFRCGGAAANADDNRRSVVVSTVVLDEADI